MNNATTDRIRILDGLRGISITLVILNHLGYGFFKGGYIGVDVFFVISGYVITRSIIGYRESPNFLSSFYERRIRRLFPSLLLVILFCYCLPLLFFAASDRLAITTSVLPSVLGVSNFLFYKQAGYFDESSIEKPLLHTWSLSVEEQFYITYALLIWILHKRIFKSRPEPAKSALRSILLLSSLASLLLSVCVTNKHPSFGYFLIPARFWEIGLGCLACLFNLRLQGQLGNLMSLLGFCFIVASCLLFNSETPYPGWHAVIPTGGLC